LIIIATHVGFVKRKLAGGLLYQYFFFRMV